MFIIFAEQVHRHCSESDLHPSGQLFHKTAIVAIRSVGFDSVISKATKSYVTYYVSFVTAKSYVSYVPKYRCVRPCSSCWYCVNCCEMCHETEKTLACESSSIFILAVL